MKIVQINAMNFGSTGNIMQQISELARKQGHDVWIAFPKNPENMKKNVENCILIGNKLSRYIHIKAAAITGFNDCFSYFATKRFIKKLKMIKPDILHFHNLHGCYINLPLLFKYVKKNNIKVVWTLHDCWSFTGQCPHFTMAKCDKWMTGCHHCKTYKEYPATYFDRTKTIWKLKKKWFTGIKDATIITPSKWLADLVKQSYLSEYPVKVINNGIDLSIFTPTESNFRKKYSCEDKFIILGIALYWGVKKGLDIFLELAKRLDDRYKIVLVGTDDSVDKQLPSNIISIHKTQNQKELAEIYSSADVFLNTTREDTFPTVNIEALACGTPVVTFKTGGSPEIPDETCGAVIEDNNIDSVEKIIRQIFDKNSFDIENCIKRSRDFDCNARFLDYTHIYG